MCCTFACFCYNFCYFSHFCLLPLLKLLQLLQLLQFLPIFIPKSREGCSGGLICAWFAVFCFVLHFWIFVDTLSTFATFAFCNFCNFGICVCKCCHFCKSLFPNIENGVLEGLYALGLQSFALFCTFATFGNFCNFCNLCLLQLLQRLQFLQLLQLLPIVISKYREACSGGLICAWLAVFCFVLPF